jgi:hypothetical protein
MSQPSIDFNAIRPLNGSRADGFEELCTQLAREARPTGSRFERKGTPDAGVECFAVLEDGTEWGWQSKYFDTLGASQWQQMDESVETMLTKHPAMVHYFICVPLNRADGRIPGRQSALENWNRHVTKWQQWATNQGRQVEFTYWGESELLNLLTQRIHLGRVRFWFNAQAFDEEWFAARLQEAVRTAGARYTPELNLSVAIAEQLAAFGRTTAFFTTLQRLARDIRENFRRLYPSSHVLAHRSIEEPYAQLTQLIQAILPAIGRIQVQPIGELPFAPIMQQLAQASQLADEIGNLLLAEELRPQDPAEEEKPKVTNRDSYHDLRGGLYRLEKALITAQRQLQKSKTIADNQLLLVSGPAGCGKTHLLCDVATSRTREGRPTVLMMGQRFVGSSDPWTQALQQLDLATTSVEEVIGALEAAAQVADCRLLLLVDALNEGNGRAIWPANLASFVEQALRSPWLGVVLSVRSSYEDYLVPAEVRSRAYRTVHQGFAGLEYDAVKSFFMHYGLELPSTPLLDPEFSNPLFLKTLCKGLQLTGQPRLPRGFHGVTEAFNLYLDGINEALARSLDYNPRQNLVRRALEAFAQATARSDERWLTLTDAMAVVNQLLPGRGHAQSLYHGLVAEGVLTEEAPGWPQPAAQEELVNIAYERLADHLLTNILLDQHLDAANPAASFAAGQPLAAFCDPQGRFNEGVLEAFFIQVPERTGHELSELAPAVLSDWHGRAFRQSLVWRKASAFSAATRQALRSFDKLDGEVEKTLEALLTVASLPEHPFNAEFLDQRLRQDSMAERDAWWSILLHQLWNTQSAVDRLVDWSVGLTATMPLDSQAVDLCALTLTWFLTSSNRFLRDRATKGLTNLLTGRLEAAGRLLERFADVNDPYVAERLYAAIYGATMRSYNAAAIASLSASVYARIFASASPPAHLLLRDYARGIVERGLHLGAALAIEPSRIRPPYQSAWPVIPTAEEIEQLFPDAPAKWQDDEGGAWARDRIKSSVMADDFGRYVIDPALDDWLNIPLSEPVWVKPKERREKLAEFAEQLSESEQMAWSAFQAAEIALHDAQYLHLKALVAEKDDTTDFWRFTAEESPELAALQARVTELTVAEDQAFEDAWQTVEETLNEAHLQQLEDLENEPEPSFEDRQEPLFDISVAKCYIVNRVLALGWRPELFGYFDKNDIGYRGREANKAERIGKKYQWIALHELLAYVADNYHFHERFASDGDRVTAYEGPWQPGVRDLDPSNILRATASPVSWSAHEPAWWAPARVADWGAAQEPQPWLTQLNDLPAVERLLQVSRPTDGSTWLNLAGHFSWAEPIPPDLDSTDTERRQLWYTATGYLVREADANAFMQWAETVDFMGRWMPEPTRLYEVFLGEHGWAPASRYYQRDYYEGKVWRQPRKSCPVEVQVFSFDYLNEQSTADCSLDETISLNLPRAELITPLDLRWTGLGADFTHQGEVAAFDPTVHENGPAALLLREDFLRDFLAREQLRLCWVVIGEKQVIGPGAGGNYYGRVNLSGAYTLAEQGITGFLHCSLETAADEDAEPDAQIAHTIRTPATL